MKPFAFRQRVGQINWKAISSVDLESVIDDNRIEQLQSIVDEVAFCDVKSADVKGTGVHDLKQLIHIMQLTIEYLLYCQESQLQLVHEMHGRNTALKSKNKGLIAKVEASKEDIRIYRRQIAVLKNSIDKYKSIVGRQDELVACPPHVFQAREAVENVPPPQENAMAPLVESMLRHERQTREFMRELIDEQRVALMRELGHSATGPSRTHTPHVRDIGEVHQVYVPHRHTQERDRERERELLETIHDLQKQVQHLELKETIVPASASQTRPVSVRSIGVNTPPVASSSTTVSTASRGLALAGSVLTRHFRKSADDSVRYSFQIWKNFLLRTTESCKLRMEADIAGARSEIMLLQEKVSTLVDQLHTEKEHRKQLQFMNDSMEEQIIELERRQHTVVTRPPSSVLPPPSVGAYSLPVGGVDADILLREALQRVQNRIIEASEDDVLDALADELLDRVELSDSISDDSHHS